MKDTNILILSAGRRVELIKSFKDAQKTLNMNNAKVIAVDISKSAPALYFADKHYIIPRIFDANYISSLIEICVAEKIDLVIPTIDTELYTLSLNKARIENECKAKVMVSDANCIEICNDKTKTVNFLKKNGFDFPYTLSEEDINYKNYKFPLFIKPRDGSSSINTFKINNDKELAFFKDYIKDGIIQEFINAKEYTVDVLLDFESRVISVVPRIRLATRSGEILKGKIEKNLKIINDVKRLMEKLKPIGHITVQCFFDGETIKYIEINPRFGGGAPMSFKAGANSPINLLKLLNGEKLEYTEDFIDGLSISRFDDSIIVEE